MPEGRCGPVEKGCHRSTTEVVGLSVDSRSADETSEAVYSPFPFNIPDLSEMTVAQPRGALALW
jgi:hypothetical protein